MNGLLHAHVLGVSVWGPGLEGWDASHPVLAGDAAYAERPSPPPPPAVLPPTERRRTGAVARLALAVATEASAMSGLAPATLRSVFGSSNGDSPVVGSILDALTRDGGGDRLVSPTQFHNSVHNAAAGYWSIATGNPMPATCLGCHDATWAATLFASLVELNGFGQPVLLCAYDHPPPPPLDAKRPTLAPFAAALVLAPPGLGTPLARLSVRHVAAPPPPGAGEPRTEALRPLARGNAAARALRLLECLARREADRHPVPYLDGHLDLEIDPCPTA